MDTCTCLSTKCGVWAILYYVYAALAWQLFGGTTRVCADTKNFCAAHTHTHTHDVDCDVSVSVNVFVCVCACVCVCLTCLLVQYSSDCKRSSYSHLFPSPPLFPSPSCSLCLLLHLRLLLILLLPYNFFSCHTNEQRAYLVCTLAACACVCLQEFSFPFTPPSRSLPLSLQQSVLLVLSRFALKCIIFAAFLVATLTTTTSTTATRTRTTLIAQPPTATPPHGLVALSCLQQRLTFVINS